MGRYLLSKTAHYRFFISLYLMKAIIIVVILFAGYSCSIYAQATDSLLFDSQEPITIDIITNLKPLIKDRLPDSTIYHPGFLSYINSSGQSVFLTVRFDTRGHFRLKRSVCKLPPIKVKIKKTDAKNSLFRKNRKLKLVNNCKPLRMSYHSYLIKEYYCYRMLNILTPYSFRVRLVRINYIDIDNRITNFMSYGFFIENVKSITRRTGMLPLKTQGIMQHATDRRQEVLVSLFQFMIGNTDWSVPKLHNIKLIYDAQRKVPIAIPYDFDYSGFVAPPYTKPPEIIPISDVRQRYFRGVCRDKNEFYHVIRYFLSKKTDILNLLESDTLLPRKEKAYSIRYISNFFDIIESDQHIKSEIIRRCRKN